MNFLKNLFGKSNNVEEFIPIALLMKALIIKQEDQEFEVRKLTHSARIAEYFRSVWLVFAILLASFTFMSGFINALYIFGMLILLSLFEFSSRTRYQILKITKEDERLRIDYLSGDRSMAVEGARSDFIFSKKPLWYKLKAPSLYLSVHYKGQSILKQDSFNDLNQKVFDWLIDHFSGELGRHSGAPDTP